MCCNGRAQHTGKCRSKDQAINPSPDVMESKISARFNGIVFIQCYDSAKKLCRNCCQRIPQIARHCICPCRAVLCHQAVRLKVVALLGKWKQEECKIDFCVTLVALISSKQSPLSGTSTTLPFCLRTNQSTIRLLGSGRLFAWEIQLAEKQNFVANRNSAEEILVCVRDAFALQNSSEILLLWKRALQSFFKL